jgi:hypothetical protein
MEKDIIVSFNDDRFSYPEDRKKLSNLSVHLTRVFAKEDPMVFTIDNEIKEINMISAYRIKKESLYENYPILINLSHSLKFPFDTLFSIDFYFSLDGKVAPISIYNFKANYLAFIFANSCYEQFEKYRRDIWDEVLDFPENGLRVQINPREKLNESVIMPFMPNINKEKLWDIDL